MVVVGSGVTGVEFTHLFESLGSQVSLLVSRQQVLPIKDAEVASALEEAFLEPRHRAAQGRPRVRRGARGRRRPRRAVSDGRVVEGSHALLAVGSIPNTDTLGLDQAGVALDDHGYVSVNHNCLSNVPHIYAAGDVSGKLPLSSVASMQGRKIAEHLMGLHNRPHRHLDYDKAASAVFTVPEIADVGLAEAEAFSSGRKIRVTKVPYTANAKAFIKGDTRGFVKLISDPSTGVVLGGSIVGRAAAELIAVVAVAVTNNLKVEDIVDCAAGAPFVERAARRRRVVASSGFHVRATGHRLLATVSHRCARSTEGFVGGTGVPSAVLLTTVRPVDSGAGSEACRRRRIELRAKRELASAEDCVRRSRRSETKRYSMTTRTSPVPTVSPSATRISLTVPATSALMWFSIFIASSTTTASPRRPRRPRPRGP